MEAYYSKTIKPEFDQEYQGAIDSLLHRSKS
jgi:hypothetical protein